MKQGIGTLNETARNMYRGPSGIGAFQQFANGGPVYMSNGGDSALNNASFEALLSAVIQTESGGDPNAVSEDDAIGLMQVLPSTAAQPGYEQYGAENVFDIAERLIGYDGDRSETDARNLLFDPEVNREFGTKYLKAMIETTGGDIYGALQKYNAGPGNYANFENDPVKNPLDQEAVRYPGLVISALGIDPEGMFRQTGSRPFAAPREADPFVSTQVPEFNTFQPMLPTIGTPPPADAPLAVEESIEGKEREKLYEKYSAESIGEQLRKKYAMPKTSMEEDTFPPQDTSAPMLEKIQKFFDKFAPPKKPERVIQPKPTPLQYRKV